MEISKGNIKPFWDDIAFSTSRRLLQRQLCRAEHIFDEDAVPYRRMIDQDVSDGTDELAVLDYRRAGHECGQ